MMRNLTIILLVTHFACSGSDDDNDGRECSLEPPAECAITPIPTSFNYPSGPYGIDVNDTFEDFTLQNCDGESVSFGQILSGAELVLFNIGAGWCAPCIEETKTIDAHQPAPILKSTTRKAVTNQRTREPIARARQVRHGAARC